MVFDHKICSGENDEEDGVSFQGIVSHSVTIERKGRREVLRENLIQSHPLPSFIPTDEETVVVLKDEPQLSWKREGKRKRGVNGFVSH